VVHQRDPAPVGPAGNYEQHLVPALFLPWAADLLRRTDPRPGERVLDVACGTGAVARQVAPLVGPGGSVTAIDISPAMLEVARGVPLSAGGRIDWRSGSAQGLPFPDGAFDLVLCQQGLQFFPDRVGALREMRRVLTAAGRIGVSVSAGLEQQPVYAAINRAMERQIGIAALAEPFSLGDAGELAALLGAAGFRDIDVQTLSRPVHFPSVRQFIRASVLGSAAAVRSLAAMGDVGREALIAAIEEESVRLLIAWISGDELAFPVAINVATAHV